MKIYSLITFFLLLAYGILAPSKLAAKADVNQPVNQANPILAPTDTLKPVASFWGVQDYERVGYNLSSAGDVNGDGLDDFLIGTFHNSQRGSDAGAAYLILGRKNFDWGTRYLLNYADARFIGERRFDAVGFVGGRGDINGDGLDDILIGAPAGNDLYPEKPGYIFAVFGKKNPDWGYSFILKQSADVKLVGEFVNDDGIPRGGAAGVAVVVVGDLNGDGCDDFITSAPFLEGYHPDAGKVYLIMGRQHGWSSLETLIDASIATFTYNGRGEKIAVGRALAALGDVNEDGINDFMIGAPGANRAFIIWGRRNPDWGIDYDLQNADVTIFGEGGNQSAGWQVAGVGDVNGDGHRDLLVSAIANYESHGEAGKTYVWFGTGASWPDTIYLAHAPASYLGEAHGDCSGWSLASIGDCNGDGLSDFLIGMFNTKNPSKSTKGYLINGHRDDWQTSLPLGQVEDFFKSEASGDLTGFCVSSAGDVNGDGWDDFLIASPYLDYYRIWGGQVLLFINPRPHFTVSGQIINGYSKSPLTGATLSFISPTGAESVGDSAGTFHFDGWAKSDYRLTIVKNGDFQNNAGVISAYDAALVAQKVLGLAKLSESSQLAADVDFDHQITLLDAAQILQFYLKKPALPQSKVGQWFFRPDTLFFPQLNQDYLTQQFNGYIRGNVDENWQTTYGNYIEKSAGLSLTPEILWIQPAVPFTIPLSVDSTQKIVAFNLQINFDEKMIQFDQFQTKLLSSPWEIQWHRLPNGAVRIAAYTTQPVTGISNLGMLVFKSLAGTVDGSEIQITDFQINDQPALEFTVQIAQAGEQNAPINFELLQNYPNPFNSTTLIRYRLPEPSNVTLQIFNALGQSVGVIHQNAQAAGKYNFYWSGKDQAGVELPSGVYFYLLKASKFQQLRKCILMR
ncbi:T9SS type A sorting domain-containing protein [candidate division KSB1 bacterium]|nr:T9SS type A sorting domain-containing protein [candidate division KSB1 bacterium]